MENIDFKIGDYVYLIDGAGIYTIEKNKSYKIVNIHMNYNGNQLIALEGITTDEIDYPFFNSRRFVKDIKPIRKKKLEKIFNG